MEISFIGCAFHASLNMEEKYPDGIGSHANSQARTLTDEHKYNIRKALLKKNRKRPYKKKKHNKR